MPAADHAADRASAHLPGQAAHLPAASAYAARLGRVSVLVVDDEPGMRNFIGRILGPLCRRIELVGSVGEASEWLAVEPFDVIVLDNILGNDRGLDWLAGQRGKGFVPPVILMSAFADLEVAITAMQAGAVDLILKPFRSSQLLEALARSVEQARLRNEHQLLKRELHRRPEKASDTPVLIGSSGAIGEVRDAVARVAPLPSTVLLTGPSGSGKEVAARLIHALSDRKDSPFVPVNSATMSETAVEAGLFGEVTTGRRGLFQRAQGGTLFMDEIAELPLAIQAQLLRVLEDRRVQPVGGDLELPVDVRLICATNADLAALVEAGRFRADLFYRINIVQLDMPSLAARGTDAVELAQHFMAQLSTRLGMAPVPLSDEVAAELVARAWPGNVRELRNLIERALILGRFPPDLTPDG